MSLLTLTDNPMWDEVSQHVRAGERFEAARVLGGWAARDISGRRFELVSQWSWTVTSPDTVAFVAYWLGSHAIDPLAGSGYWAFLLRQLGVDVVATDLNPPNLAANKYHHDGVHCDLIQMDAERSVTRLGVGRSLLLSWPPYAEPVGAQVVGAFTGERIVYIGEGEGGCCGDDDMFAAFGRDWTEVAHHEPVQFLGMHDYVHVYDRARKAVTS